MTVETVRTRAGLAALRDEWATLWAQTPEVSGFQSHAWLEVCWRHFGAGSSLYLGVVRRDGSTVAIFPTQLDRRGRLTFIGRGVSNYAGPVFLPRDLEHAVREWAEHLRADTLVKTIDLSGLRTRSPFCSLVRSSALPDWGHAVLARTNTCPEVDLRGGWQTIHERHKSKQRAAWRRKAARLGRLGQLQFAETSESASIEQAMPRMLELFSERWKGQHVSAGFSTYQEFQSEGLARLAEENAALLSCLKLDGVMIAFAYGVRGPNVTSSYVLAHDARFHRYSPGLLLLLRILEAAAARGDASYDFSVGDAPYKSLWMTGQQDVHRALWGRGRHLGALRSRAWKHARDVQWLRDLKLHGLRAVLPRDGASDALADAPGLNANTPHTSHIYRLRATQGRGASMRVCLFSEMQELLSPRLLSLALERGFRGDELLIVERDGARLGIVWKAQRSRGSALAGDFAHDNVEVFYEPVACQGQRLESVVVVLDGLATGLLVAPCLLDAPGIKRLGEVAPDPVAWPDAAAPRQVVTSSARSPR